MIYKIRLELAAALGAIAFAIAPSAGISTTITLPGIRLTKLQRSILPWHEKLRRRLRSSLSANFLHNTIVSADTAVSSFYAFIARAWTKLWTAPTISAIAAQHKWPKAYPEV